MFLSAVKRESSMTPISNWPNGWERHFSRWLEDLLNGHRKIWLMDEGMEASAPTQGAFGMRIFDAGKFHVGFGIVALSDDDTTEFSIQGVTRNGRVPFRYSLTATLYGDSLFVSAPLSPELDDAFTYALAKLVDSRAGSSTATGAQPTSEESRRRKRK